MEKIEIQIEKVTILSTVKKFKGEMKVIDTISSEDGEKICKDLVYTKVEADPTARKLKGKWKVEIEDVICNSVDDDMIKAMYEDINKKTLGS